MATGEVYFDESSRKNSNKQGSEINLSVTKQRQKQTARHTKKRVNNNKNYDDKETMAGLIDSRTQT